MSDEAATVAATIREERGAGENPAPAPKRGRGRPKGSKTKTRSTSTGGTTKTKSADEREPYKASPEGIATSALLMGTLWKVAGPMLKLDALTEDEATQLGAAVDPILHKYVPLLDAWREEINLAVALVGAYEVTKRRYRDEHPEEFVRKAKFYDDRESDREFRDTVATVVPNGGAL